MELISQDKLKEKALERERNRVRISLEACLSNLTDRRAELTQIFDDKKPLVAQWESRVIVGSEIEAVVKGKMVVPHFIPKAGAEQEVFIFIGTHWEKILPQQFFDFVKEACKCIGLSDLYAEDPAYMCKVFEYVAFRVSRHITTAQPHGGVWINLKNCTVEINSDGSIATHEHRPEDFFLYCLSYCYDEEAKCPLWHLFLDEVLPDADTQTLLGEYIGYSFTRDIKLEKMAVFYGSGANGKSVCLDVIKNLFGRSNVSEATLSSVTTDPEARTVLENKLINISSESSKKLDTAILKMLISGETVEMRKLYVGTRNLYNPPKLITSYNELPPMENTYGYRRRWLLFPFTVTIPDERQDTALTGKLCTELPGIMNWVLQLLSSLLQRVNSGSGQSFSTSEKCQEAMLCYTRNSNSVLLFIYECCKIDKEGTRMLKDLYNEYRSYCAASGIQKPCILKNFKKALIEWGAEISVSYNVKYANVLVDRSVYE